MRAEDRQSRSELANALLEPSQEASAPSGADAERFARESSIIGRRFGTLLEAAPDAMVIAGRHGRILLVNQQTEALFGYARDELLGQPVEVLVPARLRARHSDNRSNYFADPKRRPMGANLELFAQRKDGSEFPCEISLSPVDTEEGVMVTAAIRDVTESKRLLEVLRQRSLELERQTERVVEANRLKTEFLANMSHELRTPLNAIIGFSTLMYHGRVGPMSGEQREYLGDILTSSRHLLELINDVLDLAKVEAGKMQFFPQPIVLDELVRETCDTLRQLAATKSIEVSTELDPTVQGVELDSGKLRQVLYNYLSNALKFTGEGGHVTIRTRPEGCCRFRLEVEDTGVGIPVEMQDRLFMEFQQLDRDAAKNHAGSGLGLALTKRIVEAQGGRVGIRSAPGEGSTFFAELPRRSVPESADSSPATDIAKRDGERQDHGR